MKSRRLFLILMIVAGIIIVGTNFGMGEWLAGLMWLSVYAVVGVFEWISYKIFGHTISTAFTKKMEKKPVLGWIVLISMPVGITFLALHWLIK